MRNEFFANIEAGAAAVRSFACSSADRLARQLASDPAQESQNQLPCPEKPAEPTVRFSRQVLADFRSNVGRYAPETGGMMGSTEDTALVDLCHFDTLSRNTPGTFYYDVDSMTKVFHDWAEKGYRVTGIYHSHPRGCIRPSYHDISTALIHLRFFVHSFISVAPWFLFFVAIEHLGKTELAISNITRSVSTVFFVIVNSFASTTGALVSNLIGAGAGKELFPVCRKVLKLGYVVGLPLIGIALWSNQWIVGFYTNNDNLVRLAFYPFIVMLLNYAFALPGYVYINAVTGTGKTKLAFIFQLITILVYLIYLYLLSECFHASLTVYMTAEYLFVILLGIQSVIYLKRKSN